MLEARSLACAHPGSPVESPPAVGPLDLDVEAGEWLLVVGGNGSGKSALLLTLAGLIPPRAGQVRVAGQPPRDHHVAAGRPRVGFVFQEPETQFVTDRVAREIAFPLENLGWARSEIEARVGELLERFDLRALAEAPPARLSGGEMQRVALACAVAPRPTCLLLDEPTAYLDSDGRIAFTSWVRQLCRDERVAVVWTACSIEECPEADRALELAPSSAPAVPIVRTRDPGPGPAPRAGSPTAVLWRGLDLTLERTDSRGTVRIWNGLSFEIRAGESWLITGRNGSGKTALLDALVGWIAPTSGRLDTGIGPVGRSGLGYMGQFPEYQLFAPTALADVGFGLRSRGSDRSRPWQEAAREALARAGLEPARIAERPPESLSLGERRRLALAGVLVTQPTILLLDEPTVGLDPGARDRLYRILEDAAGLGLTLVIASHDPAWGNSGAIRSLALEPPRVRLAGSAQAVKSP